MRKSNKNHVFSNTQYSDMILSGVGNTPSIWVSEFEDLNLCSFYNQFMQLENDPTVSVIVIYVSSFGGISHNAFAMRDLIKSSEKIVCTVAVGKAMSSGVIILAAGTKGYRFMSEDSFIMIHQASIATDGKASDVNNTAAYLNTINDLMFKNLSVDTGTSVGKLKKLVKNNENADLFILSKQCLDLKIVDKIGIPRVVYTGSQAQVVVSKKIEK